MSPKSMVLPALVGIKVSFTSLLHAILIATNHFLSEKHDERNEIK